MATKNKSNIKVSVVIVSYNCLPFLSLCIDSLLCKNDERMEIIIVDNNSNDKTIETISKEYPSLKIIANKENKGFGRACNQGISIAKGEYYLMLNPDTIVSENLIDEIIDFMQSHPDAGAMGVYMADGKGRFLPESKRGFPSLFASFCRFSGLTKLFPTNKKISQYYLGHLPNNEASEIEILSGAFMLLNSKIIDKIGGFDERFFMYGEDIDLSWRIIQSGYKNYYNPNIKIIHFKGESSVKNKKYLKNFFGAMELFYKIHFTKKSDAFVRPIIYMLMRFLSFVKQIQFTFSRNKNEKFNINNDDVIIISNNHNTSFNNFSKFAFPSDKVKEKSTVCIDLSNLKPSEAIDFAINNCGKNLNFVWCNSSKKMMIQVLSSTDNSIIENINC